MLGGKMDTKQKIKQIIKQKCSYPNCDKRQFMTCSLPVLKQLESGQFIEPNSTGNSSISMGVPLCQDHFQYSMVGLLAVVEREDKHFIHGPFEIIETVKAVLEAEKLIEMFNKEKAKHKRSKK